MLRIKSQQSFWAGVLFMTFGAAQTWLSLQYTVGTPARMGPGFMPALLGGVLVVLGLIITANSLLVSGPKVEPIYWRPLAAIIGAMLLFALLIEGAGLALTTVLVVLVAGSGYRLRGWAWARLGALAIGMAVLAVALFIYGLRQPIPAWWVAAWWTWG